MKKKNFFCKREWLGYCPIFRLSHNTTSCIVTGRAWETGLGTQQARRGAQGVRKGRAWSAMIRPAGPRYGQGRPRHSQQRARARPSWWIVSRYTVLYRDKGEGLAAGGCVTIQSLYRDRRAVWLAGVSRYNQLYRDRRRLGNWLCRDTMLQHGREGTTIRRKRHATLPRARDITRSAREARARPATRPAIGCDTVHNKAATRPAWV